jgi:uncharacterized membrane protein (DUF4010 family)
VVAAGTATLVLTQRRSLHRWLRGMSVREIEAVGYFALVALVLLPLMPDRDMGPFGAWNPRSIWLVVTLVCGISFVGYAAARRRGTAHRALLVAGLGALVSSTALTLIAARRMRAEPVAVPMLEVAIVVASAVMLVRVLLMTALLAPFALAGLAHLLAPALVLAIVIAALGARSVVATKSSTRRQLPRNPLDLGPALLLALLVASLAVVARWVQVHYGARGVAILLLATGIVDVDAAVITLSRLPLALLNGVNAGALLSLPVIADTVLKAVITLIIAGPKRGGRAALVLLGTALAIVAALIVSGELGKVA